MKTEKKNGRSESSQRAAATQIADAEFRDVPYPNGCSLWSQAGYSSNITGSSRFLQLNYLSIKTNLWSLCGSWGNGGFQSQVGSEKKTLISLFVPVQVTSNHLAENVQPSASGRPSMELSTGPITFSDLMTYDLIPFGKWFGNHINYIRSKKNKNSQRKGSKKTLSIPTSSHLFHNIFSNLLHFTWTLRHNSGGYLLSSVTIPKIYWYLLLLSQ